MKMAGKWNNNHGRHCADFAVIYIAKRRVIFFDIIGFKQFLFEQTEMSPGTVREYVVRLRRLGESSTRAKYFPRSAAGRFP